MRHFSRLDRCLVELGHAMNTLTREAAPSTRPVPKAPQVSQPTLSDSDRVKSIGYMRVNHVGEVCAQALYYGQAFTTHDPKVVKFLKHAAHEETDHLYWCHTRLNDLKGRVSYLNPLWYASSFALGAIAGYAGVEWGLGFVAETERQVGDHLTSHLHQLPQYDQASKVIVQQMLNDELEHAQQAHDLGARTLPHWMKEGMNALSVMMKHIAYYV